MSTTFSDSNYSVENYLKHRPRYPRELYETILEFHNEPMENHPASPPQTKLALDLGCGPGTATAELLAFFDKVIGVDCSEKMITMVKPIIPQAEFHVGGANALSMIESGTVDLITAATAAHWFPPDWWKEAGRVLKPGGTIAVWIYSENLIVEPSHPKSRELSQTLSSLVNEIELDSVGNQYASGMYDTLPLPTSGFTPPKKFSWNLEGSTDEKLFMTSHFTIGTLRKQIHTYSPVHRWRLKNPIKKDTRDDPVEKVLQKLKNLTGWDESMEFVAGFPLCLILMKRL